MDRTPVPTPAFIVGGVVVIVLSWATGFSLGSLAVGAVAMLLSSDLFNRIDKRH